MATRPRRGRTWPDSRSAFTERSTASGPAVDGVAVSGRRVATPRRERGADAPREPGSATTQLYPPGIRRARGGSGRGPARTAIADTSVRAGTWAAVNVVVTENDKESGHADREDAREVRDTIRDVTHARSPTWISSSPSRRPRRALAPANASSAGSSPSGASASTRSGGTSGSHPQICRHSLLRPVSSPYPRGQGRRSVGSLGHRRGA